MLTNLGAYKQIVKEQLLLRKGEVYGLVPILDSYRTGKAQTGF